MQTRVVLNLTNASALNRSESIFRKDVRYLKTPPAILIQQKVPVLRQDDDVMRSLRRVVSEKRYTLQSNE